MFPTCHAQEYFTALRLKALALSLLLPLNPFTLVDFLSLRTMVLAAKAKAKGKAKAQAKAVAVDAAKILSLFKSYDQNDNGVIEKEELIQVMQALDEKLWTRKNCEALLKTMDHNKDGKVDYDDFMCWISASSTTASKVEAVMRSGEIATKAAEEARAARNQEGMKELNVILEALFKCYDEDEDGKIERIEHLGGEERRLGGQLNFGVKERKAAVAWFKEAGAEGTPADGMYLDQEKWSKAMIELAIKESGFEADDFAKLSEFIHDTRLKPFEDLAAAEEKKKGPAADSAPAVDPGKAPEYPLNIPLTELDIRVTEAHRWGKIPLVLSQGQDAVDMFFAYRNHAVIDCMVYVGKMYVKKEMSKEEARSEITETVKKAMCSTCGFCKPLLVRLGKSAFDWNGMLGDKLHEDLFSPALWTPKRAHELGIIDGGQKMNLECDEKKWSDFNVTITSNFTAENYKEYLEKMIPHFEELAVLIINKID
eukprot:TRINITY_DN19103_c0_g1_i1.p1 TRINITY_DN19103_c0_g1~~TRINITY_DN19103_c0_g1_i1.p1  ORF type:complete len:482 (-),score=134.28 TRINITY_DN19103_c0_g1_i1:286-1731(-)